MPRRAGAGVTLCRPPARSYFPPVITHRSRAGPRAEGTPVTRPLPGAQASRGLRGGWGGGRREAVLRAPVGKLRPRAGAPLTHPLCTSHTCTDTHVLTPVHTLMWLAHHPWGAPGSPGGCAPSRAPHLGVPPRVRPPRLGVPRLHACGLTWKVPRGEPRSEPLVLQASRCESRSCLQWPPSTSSPLEAPATTPFAIKPLRLRQEKIVSF